MSIKILRGAETHNPGIGPKHFHQFFHIICHESALVLRIKLAKLGNIPGLDELVQSGVEVLADDFSLRERGIPTGRLQAGIKSSPLDVVVDGLAEGCKVIWH